MRKDVERVFGRLLIKWHILSVATRSYFLRNVKKILHACFILHDMTIGDIDDTWYDSGKELERYVQQCKEQARDQLEWMRFAEGFE